MFLLKRASTIVLGLFLCSLIISAQQTSNPTAGTSSIGPGQEAIDAQNRQREMNPLPGQDAALRKLGDSVRSDPDAQRSESAYRLKTFEFNRNTLLVAGTYHNKFAALLTDKKVLLAKLDGRDCNEGSVIPVTDIGKCNNALPVWGGGSYYSFRNKTNFNTRQNNWSDIQLLDHKFVVGNNRIEGIISRIGDVALDNVNAKSPEMAYLINYTPHKNLAEFQSQKSLLEKGATSNGFFYSSSIPVELNSTYVVRTIAYKLKKNEIADNRADMMIVFKVVGLEKDGSVVILWKELKKKGASFLKE